MSKICTSKQRSSQIENHIGYRSKMPLVASFSEAKKFGVPYPKSQNPIAILVINRPWSDFSGPQATFKKKTSPQRENPEAVGRWHLGILLLDVGLHVIVTLDVLPHNRQGSFGLPQHQETVQLRQTVRPRGRKMGK